MSLEQVVAGLQEVVGEEVTAEGVHVQVPAEKIVAVAEKMRELGYDLLSCVTAVDWPEEGKIEVVYVWYSTGEGGSEVVVHAFVGRENPEIDSLTPIWPGADLQEREVYDMFGVRFRGHPNHKRLLMWEEFEDFPLRKDYQEVDDRPPRRPWAHIDINA